MKFHIYFYTVITMQLKKIFFFCPNQIIKDRIEKEYKLEPYFGQLQISYRESVDQTAEHLLIDEKVIKNVRNSVQIRLRLSPCDPHLFQLPYKVKVILTAENELYKLRHDRLNAIESGVQTALDHGSILGFPVINCSVELLEFVCPFTTMPSFVSAAVQRCVHEALRSAQPYLLEPIMRLEVTGPETMYGTVLKDLTNRRSTIESCSIKNKQRVVIAYTPLSELSGYSTDLRRLTSGKANLFMQLHEYERMNAADQHRVLHQMQGYV